MSASPPTPPLVDVVLSRPTYRVGGTIVGTVRVVTAVTRRESVDSLLLSAAAFCRLDARWHNCKNTNNKLLESRNNVNGSGISTKIPEDWKLPQDTYPVWSAGTIELMDLQERQVGSWEESRPKPIVLPGRQSRQYRKKIDAMMMEETSLNEHEHEDNNVRLEERQLAFTFRIDLPNTLPHTLVATSCRYYYSIAVRLQMKEEQQHDATTDDGSRTTIKAQSPRWIQIPVTVLTAVPTAAQHQTHVAATDDSSRREQQQHDDDDNPNNIIPSIQAVAHSSGLPTLISATELHQFDGQYSVNRHGGSLFRHVGRQNVQSMKVEDPNSGKPACVLTILGAPVLHPGCRLVLKLDFPRRQNTTPTDWIPCYQASACLQGEEMAIQHPHDVQQAPKDGTQKRQRARRHLFSTDHREIDPETTESIQLNLTLPQSAPCTIRTDVVEITVQMVIDIAVGTTTKGDGGFRNLRLEIPCTIVHAMSDWECHDEEDVPPAVLAVEKIWETAAAARERSTCNDNYDPTDPNSFRSCDIRDELKILSLSMADACGLRPQPPSMQPDSCS